MLQTEVFEIIIVTTDSAAFIHFKGFLFSTSGVPDLSWEIYISGIKKVIVNEAIKSTFTNHDGISVVYTDVVKRLFLA